MIKWLIIIIKKEIKLLIITIKIEIKLLIIIIKTEIKLLINKNIKALMVSIVIETSRI